MGSDSLHGPQAPNTGYAEYFVMLDLSLMVIALRIVARIAAVGRKQLWWDDYVMILAVPMLIVETALAWIIGARWKFMANDGLTAAERADIMVGSIEHSLRVSGSKAQLANQNLYTALIWTIKCSVCAFYLRFTSSLENFKLAAQIAFGFTGVTWSWVHLTLLAPCRPFYRYWQINPDPGKLCQAAVSPLFLITCLVLDIITDVYLFAIPMFMFWKASLPISKKLGLAALFSGTIAVIISAICRYISIQNSPHIGTKRSTDWAFREILVSIVVSNLPIIWSSIVSWRRERKRRSADLELGTTSTAK